jgi:predicted DNA-binding transcriptional regulator YafY
MKEKDKVSTRLERLLYIASRIGEGGYPSVEDFADRFEVNRRTILRDIEFLEARFHAPIAYSRSRQGYYLTDAHWTLSTLPVTEGQLLAFLLSIELVEQYLGTPFEKPLRTAIEHISKNLTDEVQISVRELINHYSIRRGAAAKTPFELLLVMFQAIQHHHPLQVVYFTASRGVETQRVIHPYHVFNIQGEWHLVAYDLVRQTPLQFALQRIREWRVLEEETFAVDPAFSLDDYFARSFQAEHSYEPAVEIVLQFDAYQAPYIRERTWHPSQQIEELAGGEIIVRFTTGAISAMKRWIMSYGSHVRVLAPSSIAQSIIDEFYTSLAVYENST